MITNDRWMVIESTNYPGELQELFDSHTGTGGLEIYFVKEIYDTNGWVVWGVNSAHGCAVATNGNFRTLAHEIGHACGLHDIYDTRSDLAAAVTGEVREAWAPDDWNGGPGPLYYEPGLEQAELVRRLLMYGYGGTAIVKGDIPLGRVLGITWNGQTNLVKVGLRDMNRNPKHQ